MSLINRRFLGRRFGDFGYVDFEKMMLIVVSIVLEFKISMRVGEE